METAAQWRVDREFYDPFSNYLIYGWGPGGCFTSVLANDFFMAVQRSHPSNTIEAFKRLTGWINDRFPRAAWGSYDKVEAWTRMSAAERRSHLEAARLVYTEREEVELALRGVETAEPYLY